MLSDVAHGNHTQQRVCDCVRQDIRVRVSFKSERVRDLAVGGDNAVFVFHVLTRTKIDSSASVFNQEPAGGNVPKTDSLFDVSVKTSASDVGHVERRAAE